MAQYRLRAQHVIDGAVYGPGTIVGDGAQVPFSGEPSTDMDGYDEEGKQRVNELHQRLYGRDAPWHTENPKRPMNVDGQPDDEAAPTQEQRLADEGKEPIPKPEDVSRGGGPEQPVPYTPTENREPVEHPTEELLPKVD